jgi:nucleotide-binding universal stress UspA family protein
LRQIFALTVFKPREIGLLDRVRTACDPNLGEIIEEINSEGSAACRQSLTNLLASDARYARVQPLYIEGDPVDVILSQVGQRQVSVLAIGSHTSNLFERLVLGSISEQLIHRAPAHAIFVTKQA